MVLPTDYDWVVKITETCVGTTQFKVIQTIASEMKLQLTQQFPNELACECR